MFGKGIRPSGRFTEPAIMVHAPFTDGVIFLGLTLQKVISQRYEQGSILLTTNQPYKHWPKIFNNDSTLTSAVLDRLLHHAETVIIEGKSYRMKDQIETP